MLDYAAGRVLMRPHLGGRPNRRSHPGEAAHPDVESTPNGVRILPDAPNLDMEVGSRAPTGGFDAVCQGCGAAIHIQPGAEPPCARCGRNEEPPTGSALFPEIPTWSDEQPVIAIELADRREPGLNLYVVGDLPDRHRGQLDQELRLLEAVQPLIRATGRSP